MIIKLKSNKRKRKRKGKERKGASVGFTSVSTLINSLTRYHNTYRILI